MRLIWFHLIFVAYCLHVSNGGGGGGKEKVHLKIHIPKIVKHHHHTKIVYVKKGKDDGHDDHKKVIIHKHEHNHKHKHDHGHKHGHKHNHKHGHKHGHNHKHGHEHKHGHKHAHKHGHNHKHGHDHKHGHKHDHKHGHNHKHGHDHKHGHKHSHKKEHKPKHYHDIGEHYGYEQYANGAGDDYDVGRYQTNPQSEDIVNNKFLLKTGYRVEEDPYDVTTKAYHYAQITNNGQQFVPSYGSAFDAGYSSPYAKKLYDYDDDIVLGKQAHNEDSHEDLQSYDYENEGGTQYDDGKENLQEYSNDYSDETQNKPIVSKLPLTFGSQQQPSQVSIQKVPLKFNSSTTSSLRV